MAASNKWTEELTIQMIKEYEKYDYLWNPVSIYYKNKAKREEGYYEMINKLKIEGLTIKELKNKIKNIRSSYSVELKKIRVARRRSNQLSMPAGVPVGYRPSVTWFEHADRFLRAIVTPVSVENSLLEGANTSEDNDAEDILASYDESPPPAPSPPPPPPPEKKPHKRRKSTPYVLNTPSPRPLAAPFPFFPQPEFLPRSASFLTTPPPNEPKKKRRAEAAEGDPLETIDDEFDMFARLIANNLRKLPLGLALDTQLKIQTLVNTARVQALYQQYSYSTSGMSPDMSSAESILSSLMSQHSSAAAAMSRAMREPSLDIKSEVIKSEVLSDNED